MSEQFMIVNGLLVHKPFVGPLFEKVKERVSIAQVHEHLENVNPALIMQKHLEEQQALSSKLIDTPDAKTDAKTTKHKVIRRRRKFVYSQADQLLSEKGYWTIERRSLTKLHSNSLMWEYSQVQSGMRYHPEPTAASGIKPRKVLRRSKPTE